MPATNELESESFQFVADFVPVMLWRITADFKCDWVNQAWLDYTGEQLADQIDFAWLDRLHPDDMERVSEQFDLAFRARESITIEFRLRRHDGAYRWFRDSGAPVYRNGDFAGFVGSCVDVTEGKSIEVRLELARTATASLLSLLTPVENPRPN